MKILLIIGVHGHGGTTQHVANLARSLQDRADVTVVCDTDSWLAGEMKKSDIKLLECGLPGSVINPPALWKLVSLGRRGKFDIIHAHGYMWAMYGYFASLFSGAKLVTTSHSLIPAGLRWHRKASLIVTVSEACAVNLRAEGVPESLIRVVHNGVPVELSEIDRADCRRRIRQELGIGDSAPFSIAIGRISKGKGHDLFVSAAARVSVSIPDAHFAIMGRKIPDAPETVEIDRIIEERGLGGSITFTGHRHDMADIIAAADLLCVPSRMESFGQSVVESMLIGTPVIVSDVGGLPEIVESGESGIVIPSENVDALATAMLSVLSSRSFADRLSENGTLRAKSLFLTDGMADKMLGIYEEALKH